MGASRRQGTPWHLIVPVGLIYGLVMSAQVYLSSTMAGRPYGWGKSLALQMPIAAAWLLFTPVILALGRRYPIVGSRWLRDAGVHLLVSMTFIFLLDLFASWFQPMIVAGPVGRTLLARTARLFVIWIVSDGMVYWSILLVSLVVAHYRRLRERELIASQLETQLAQADLQALKSQLHPHFLFNALHTIGSLVRTGDRDSAVKVTADLGELLRRMLDGASQQEVPLRQELDFIRSYLDIEQIRFRDRLRVKFDVEEAVLDARVPHLVLQPLVENAIRHGIAPHLFAGNVVVRARRSGDRLELLVRDDGPGAGVGEGSRPGIGLTNTRARLERLYGEDFVLDVANFPAGGLEARIELPFRLALAEWERST
jgi:two-component sensor histidine kinase